MEAEQHASEQPKNHRRNQKRNQNMHRKNHQPDSTRNKGRKIKPIKLEMKMERSQQTTQKYKGS